MPCRPSTSTRRVRRPSAARPSASAAATVVLPVPPLPVTTCSRAGHLLLTLSPMPPRYGGRSAGDLTDQPASLTNHRELQVLLRCLLVAGGHRHLDRDDRAVLAGAGDGRIGPAVDRVLI